MKVLGRMLAVLLLSWLTLLSFAGNTVTFSLVESAGETDVFVDSNKNVAYHSFKLGSPSRFVIDLGDAHLQWKAAELPINPVIKAIRHSLDTKNNRLRLVFDLKYSTDVSVKKTKTLKGMRLIIRLKHKPVSSRGRDVVVVIDPGHGGKDPGALGRRHKREKDIVLSISKELARAINQQPGFKAYLTRSTDYYLTLRQRLEIARRYHADMFVAIHADAYRRKAAYGASVYALSLKGASSEAARWLANRENDSELMGGVALSDKSHVLKSVLLNLSQTATLRASLDIGNQVLHALGQVAHLHYPKVEQAAFVVLKSPDIPSLLIETGFISNDREELNLTSSAYQKKLANAITQGISHYFTRKPPRGTWLAQQKK